MATFSHRLQVLLDEERLRRLELQARTTGASVGSLVRDAIDVAYPGTPTDRERAAASFLGADPIEVEDWDEMKAEINTMREKWA